MATAKWLGKWVLVVIGVFLALFIVAVLWRMPAVEEQLRTDKTVAEIKAMRITMADVDGSKLPPQPDPALADATVEGIDANENGVRDDVELEIFRRYPNDAKTRAAMLQYAMTEQLFLTYVFNTESWKAAAEMDGRANVCVKTVKLGGSLQAEVENLIFNTERRAAKLEESGAFTTSYGPEAGQACDVYASESSQ